jgi:ferric-dicitrate binding protein FerR (iron transport regulator)
MERLQTLFKRYIDNSLSEAEYTEFWQLLEQEGGLEQLSPELQAVWNSKLSYSLPAATWNKKLRVIRREHSSKTKKLAFLRYAAAAILLLVAGGTYLSLRSKPPDRVAVQTVMKSDIAPGDNGAILSFSNGKTIVLDTARNGQLMEGVVKTDGNVTVGAGAMEYATLTTPRAKQQQLVLDDGTKVWLNAASSIRFPSVFTANKRIVEVTGEAYFEVAKNPAKPFIVQVGGGEIEVLGTHFNVMAYDNENSVQTTLLEGSVKFSKGSRSVMLKPGEQSRLGKDGSLQVVPDADIELATAWKNGQQLFKKADLASIMRQVERWYNVDVTYQATVPANITFSGDLPRNVNLSKLLKVFEGLHVHFVIDAEKRKVIVTE